LDAYQSAEISAKVNDYFIAYCLCIDKIYGYDANLIICRVGIFTLVGGIYHRLGQSI